MVLLLYLVGFNAQKLSFPAQCWYQVLACTVNSLYTRVRVTSITLLRKPGIGMRCGDVFGAWNRYQPACLSVCRSSITTRRTPVQHPGVTHRYTHGPQAGSTGRAKYETPRLSRQPCTAVARTTMGTSTTSLPLALKCRLAALLQQCYFARPMTVRLRFMCVRTVLVVV